MFKLAQNVFAVLACLWGINYFILKPLAVSVMIRSNVAAVTTIIAAVIVMVAVALPFLLRR